MSIDPDPPAAFWTPLGFWAPWFLGTCWKVLVYLTIANHSFKVDIGPPHEVKHLPHPPRPQRFARTQHLI